MSGSGCPFGGGQAPGSSPSKRLVALAPARKSSLYEKLGGRDVVRQAVDVFYVKVMLDRRVKHFFKNVNLPRQRSKLLGFMTLAFGGPSEYAGRSLYDAHHGLNLTEEHFTAIVECFVATLQELGVGKELLDECVAVVGSGKDQIIGH